MSQAPKRTIVGAILAVFAACGGGNGPITPSHENPYRITIASSGAVGPTELAVPPGTRVLFVNNDSRRHDMTSDPHPEHNLCSEINQVGLLQPGQRRETGNLVTVRTCGFHDHENPDNRLLTGQLVIR